MKLRVLFDSHSEIGALYGGGPSVIFGLRDALMSLNVDVVLRNPWVDRAETFDIVHYFSTYESTRWLNRSWKVPLVVTPITWFDRGRRAQLESVLKYGLRALRHRTTNRLKLGYPFLYPDAFFPNSQGELELLASAEHVDPAKMTIVPHGVSASFAEGDETLFHESHPFRDFILCVGRFEAPRKNQLALVKAWRDEKTPLVFIGGFERGSESFYEECRAKAGPNTHFLDPMDHDDPMLRSAYHAARVVVLPALLESPGLAGLEAALGGATVAATKNGSTREYYGSSAFFFDPTDLVDIRATLRKAVLAPRSGDLRKRTLEKYTWDRIAEVQLKAYRQTLSKFRSGS